MCIINILFIYFLFSCLTCFSEDNLNLSDIFNNNPTNKKITFSQRIDNDLTIFKHLQTYQFPEDFITTNQRNILLTKIYAGYLALEEKKDFDEHALIQALFKFFKDGNKIIILSKGEDGISVFHFLQAFSFQYMANSPKDIFKWYNQKGKNKTRREWGIDAVNEILNSSTFPKHWKFYIAEITKFYPVQIMQEEDIRKWWNDSLKIKGKNEPFKTWAKEALLWGLKNIDSNDKKVAAYAFQSVYFLMDKKVLLKMKIIENVNTIYYHDSIIKNKKRLLEWFDKNRKTIDPRNNILSDHYCNF